MLQAHYKRIAYIAIPIALAIALVVWNTLRDTTPNWVTATVSTGTVRSTVAVSGTVDAVGTANLAFPATGVIESIAVKEGDTVTKGQVLATLVHTDLKADYKDAEAALMIAQANKEELLNGLRPEDRDISHTTALIAEEDLVRVTKEQNERVQNAYRTLLSSDLEAVPEDLDTVDTPPIISGAYTCKEGTYTINTFNSGAQSGYSYRLSGLEAGTFTAHTETAGPLGACGLTIQFITGVSYGNAMWTVEIPNKKSTSYTERMNAYTLALTQRENAIREAEQKRTLALQTNTLDIATPRAEAIARAEASVLQAQARLSVVESQINNHILTAPFNGIVTHIEPIVGESVDTTPAITMVSDDAFILTALIPELNITKVAVGQHADIIFDAHQEEALRATVNFISPLAKEIDGVAYFEAKLSFEHPPIWLRGGLNADIDIIVNEKTNVNRIPKRYLISENDSQYVLVPNGKETKKVPVQVEFIGNDGFVEILGLDTNTTVVAP